MKAPDLSNKNPIFVIGASYFGDQYDKHSVSLVFAGSSSLIYAHGPDESVLAPPNGGSLNHHQAVLGKLNISDNGDFTHDETTTVAIPGYSANLSNLNFNTNSLIVSSTHNNIDPSAGVYGYFVDRDLNSSDRFSLMEATAGSQHAPKVSINGNGSFVTIYSDRHESAVALTYFDADQNKITGTFLDTAPQSIGDLIAFDEENWVGAYITNNQAYLLVFNSTESTLNSFKVDDVGSVISTSTYSDTDFANSLEPQLALDSDGNIGFLWVKGDATTSDIWFQKLDIYGNAVSQPIQLVTSPTSINSNIDLEFVEEIGWVAAWQENDAGNSRIQVSTISIDGDLVGDNLLLSDIDSVNVHPEIEYIGNNTLAVAWTRGDANDIDGEITITAVNIGFLNNEYHYVLSDGSVVFHDLNDGYDKLYAEVPNNLSRAYVKSVENLGGNLVITVDGQSTITFNDGLDFASTSVIEELNFIHDGNQLSFTPIDINFNSQLIGSGGEYLFAGSNGNDKYVLKHQPDSNLVIFGNEGNDYFDLSGFDDLNGDWIYLGEGNDFINAGTGKDMIYTGLGTDLVYMTDPLNRGSALNSWDELRDFSGSDKILFDASDLEADIGQLELVTADNFTGGNEIIYSSQAELLSLNVSAKVSSGVIAYIEDGNTGGPSKQIIFDEDGDFTSGSRHIAYISGNADASNLRSENFVAVTSNSVTDRTLIIGADSINETLTHETTSNATIFGFSGDDTLIGNIGDDVLFGGFGNDQLIDGSGDDEVYGDQGDDTIFNIGGTDIFNGGSGSDTLVTDVSVGFTPRSFEVGFDTISGNHGRIDSDLGQDIIESIENFTLIGDFNAGVIGGDENNIFFTDAGDDIIQGGGGDDIIGAWLGNDQVYAGQGDDTIFNTGGEDLFDGGEGLDTLITDLSESVKATIGIQNWDFDIILDLGASDPHMRHYGLLPDGTEFAWDELYNIENYSLVGNFDANLKGDDYDNRLISDTGNDRINGSAGNDYLDAGGGEDIVLGGSGSDVVSGGAGIDTFISYREDWQGDKILDYQAGESLVFMHDAFSAYPWPELVIIEEEPGTYIVQQSDDLTSLLAEIHSVETGLIFNNSKTYEGVDEAGNAVFNIEFVGVHPYSPVEIRTLRNYGNEVELGLFVDPENENYLNGVQNFQATVGVDFDLSLLEDTITAAGDLDSFMSVSVNEMDNEFTVSAAALNPVTDLTKPILTFNANIPEGLQTAEFSIFNAELNSELVNPVFNEIDLVSSVVEIFITDRSGNVVDVNNIDVLSGENVFSAEKLAPGHFEFIIDRKEDTILSITPSDDDLISFINSADAREALRLAVGYELPSGETGPQVYLSADYNNNGRVSSSDALEILKAAVLFNDALQPYWHIAHIDETSSTNRWGVDLNLEGGTVELLAGDTTDTLNLTAIIVGDIDNSAGLIA